MLFGSPPATSDGVSSGEQGFCLELAGGDGALSAFDSDHIVQHILGQPNPTQQGSADPGSCEVSGHWHPLVIDI